MAFPLVLLPYSGSFKPSGNAGFALDPMIASRATTTRTTDVRRLTALVAEAGAHSRFGASSGLVPSGFHGRFWHGRALAPDRGRRAPARPLASRLLLPRPSATVGISADVAHPRRSR